MITIIKARAVAFRCDDAFARCCNLKPVLCHTVHVQYTHQPFVFVSLLSRSSCLIVCPHVCLLRARVTYGSVANEKYFSALVQFTRFSNAKLSAGIYHRLERYSLFNFFKGNE
jgi:hypothetical protein